MFYLNVPVNTRNKNQTYNIESVSLGMVELLVLSLKASPTKM